MVEHQLPKLRVASSILVYRSLLRRSARVVDRAALEMRCTRKGTGGSNPSFSAKSERAVRMTAFFIPG